MVGLAAPQSSADLAPRWLSDALAGVAEGAHVTHVDMGPIGNGLVSASLRLELGWDRPTPAPTVLVAKVPADAEQSRTAAAATRTYEIEAGFYAELARTVRVNCPRCYASVFDPKTGGYAVLLEDLSPATAGDQLSGCSADEAAAAIPELVALHAPRWDDATLLRVAWLNRPDPDVAAFTAELVRSFVPGFLDRYSSRLDEDVLALVERLGPRLGEYLGRRDRPWTLLHGDFRLDNLLFGGDRVAVVDWQTISAGPAMADVSYFIGASLLVADRRSYEQHLVRDYRARLAQLGIAIDWEDCWTAYRRHAFAGLIMAVAASMLVARTERGDEMFLAMASRHGRQALDLEAESLLAT